MGKDFLTNDVIVTPHASLGVIEQFNTGGTATGNFASGDGFSIGRCCGDGARVEFGTGTKNTAGAPEFPRAPLDDRELTHSLLVHL